MLNKEDNELICRVGPGTPMGSLMRQYWLPALLSAELPEPDGQPLRLRLLGEDLVAFRDTQGQVGLLGANCPHRGAPLYFGRNEECGLRCIYHGWKFDVGGRCVAMPNVPAESDYKDKVRATAYPCVERNGVIWTHLGPLDTPPELPRFDWNVLPPEHSVITKQYLECSYAQGMEGDFDGSHISFLHAPLTPGIHREAGAASDQVEGEPEKRYVIRTTQERRRFSLSDPRPLIMVLNTDYGLFTSARRNAGPDDYFWRFNIFVMPFYAGVPREADRPAQINIWQPIDDDNTMVWRVTYLADRPYTAEEREQAFDGNIHLRPEDYLPLRPERPGSEWLPKQNRGADYFMDRAAQRTSAFAGVPGVWAQDRTCTEGMGAIMDRTREHLGPSDAAIIQLRRTLMTAARALQQQGATPPGLDAVPAAVGLPSQVLPRSLSWEEITKEAFGGIHLPSGA